MHTNVHLDKFTGEVEAVYDGGGDLWNVREGLARLAASPVGADYVNGELEELARVGSTTAALNGDGSKYLLAQVRDLSLSIHVVRSTALPTRLHGATLHRMISPLGSIPVTVHLWEQPTPEPNDVLETERRLHRASSTVLHRGDVQSLRAGYDVVALTAEGYAPLIVLESQPVYPLIWEYDVSSLEPLRLIASSPVTSRLEYTALMLAEMAHESAVPQLVRLAEHADYSVRWAAIRAVSGLDEAAGRRLLHRAATDQHPQIRAAASRVLATLQ